MKFNLGQKNFVKGVVCSTNYNPEDETEFTKLKCEDTLKSMSTVLGVSKSANSYFLNCPKECSKEIDNNIYGASNYKDTSSLCRSAIHAECLDDSGGDVLVSTIYLNYVTDT